MTNQIKLLFKKILFAIFLLASCSTPVWAETNNSQNSMTVTPTKIKMNINSSQSINKSFEIINSGNKKITVEVDAKPYSVIDKSYQQFSELDHTAYTQISRWIKFDQKKYSINPNEKKVVNFKVETPSDIPGGSQHAIIFVKTVKANDEGSINTLQRIGIKLYAKSTGVSKTSGELLPIKIPFFQSKAKMSFTTTIKNNGNTDFTNTKKIKVMDIFGNEKFNYNGEFDILAGTKREISAEWDKTPKIGLFKIKVTNDFIDKNKTHEQYVFFLSPIITIIIVLALFTIIGFIFYKNNRR